MGRYAALAIPHYWIVDPDGRSVACYRLGADVYRHVLAGEGDAELMFAESPDFRIALADLWR